MDSKQMKQLLDEIATEEISETMDLRPMISGALPMRGRRAKSVLTAAKVALALILMLCAAVAGYALYQEATSDPGITAVEEADLVTRLGETQSLTGKVAERHQLQVTLDYAYADANRITVAYTINATSDTPIFISYNPRLTSSDGEFLRMLLGNYGTPETNEQSDGLVAYSTTAVMNFDATTLPQSGDTLSLKLDVDVAISYPDSDMPERMEMAGTATFAFSVPFIPGRVMDEAQTVSAGDLTLTLQKVVVTPSLTRIEMCYPDPAPEGRTWAVFGELAVDGNPVVENIALNEVGPSGELGDEEAPCHTLIIPQALQNQDGEWTLSITDFRLPGSEDTAEVVRQMDKRFNILVEAREDGSYVTHDPSDAQALSSVLHDLQDRMDGPWVFTFRLPQ